RTNEKSDRARCSSRKRAAIRGRTDQEVSGRAYRRLNEAVRRVMNVNCEEALLPHLDAAYNLARWLTRDERDAEDIVQEAYLRALRHYRTFKGGDARPWLLAIVRNTYYTWRKHNRLPQEEAVLEEDKHPLADDSSDPE